MMARASRPLTKTMVEHAEGSRYGAMLWDSRVMGFGCRVFEGKREFVYRYRTPEGKQRKVRLGTFGAVTVEQARRMAADLYEQVRRGEDPVALAEAERETKKREESERRTVGDVLDAFIERHARGSLRAAREYQSVFDRLVKPAIGDVDVYSLRRSQIAEMLDTISESNGRVMALRTLAYLRSALNWWAARDDDFVVPLVKRMASIRPSEIARDRVLDDDEIRTLWAATETIGEFGPFVRLLLLTGQRRGEVAGMRRQDVAADGTWIIPAAAYKTNREHVVPLPAQALEIINERPQGPDGSVFPPSFAGSGKPKERLDRVLTLEKPWRLHDLRRTARSLMSRAGIRPDIAERVLGHVIAGVEGVYDRHSYLDEKRHALEALAALVGRIVANTDAEVVPLRAKSP